MPTGDPDLIKRAPTDQIQPDADSDEVARAEARKAVRDAAVGKSELRTKFGEIITVEELRTVAAITVAGAGFVVICWLTLKDDHPFQTPAWSALVALVSGAVGYIFGGKGRS